MWEWRKKSDERKKKRQQKTSLACLLDFEAVVNCSKCETHTITLLHSVYLNEQKEAEEGKKTHSRPMLLETKWSTHKREEEEKKNERNNTKETTIWLFGCALRIWNSWMHDCQALGSTVQCVTVGRCFFFSLFCTLCCCARDLIHTICFFYSSLYSIWIFGLCFFSLLFYIQCCASDKSNTLEFRRKRDNQSRKNAQNLKKIKKMKTLKSWDNTNKKIPFSSTIFTKQV